ncbi:MAG: Na/Pi cotransporter family protein [Halanaerobiaceae bacterium]
MPVFLSGLFLFLLGLEGVKKGLQQLTATRIRSILASFTENIYLCIGVGIFVTGILQSSSAVSIIIIGLLEAKIIDFKPAFAIMMGANIGTTLTVQIISLPVLTTYPYLLGCGIFFMLTGLIRKKLFWSGLVLLGFGIVFGSLQMMISVFMKPDLKDIIYFLLKFCTNNVLYGIMLGIIVTAIIQSSSAVTGITVSLARKNLITLPVAIAIALGSNIGTCITAFLASINGGTNARALALGHFLFNVIGIILIFPLLPLFINFIMFTDDLLPRQIANAHTTFNIFNLIIFIPLTDTFVSILRRRKWRK